jgi:hypothetical protein
MTKKKKKKPMYALTASCGGSGCTTHYDILPLGIWIKTPKAKAA